MREGVKGRERGKRVKGVGRERKRASTNPHTFSDVVRSEAYTLMAANPPLMSRTLNPALFKIEEAMAAR